MNEPSNGSDPSPRGSSLPESSALEPSRSRVLLRQLIEYRRGRRRTGEIVLRVRALRREAHLITLEDGEHLILLVLDNALCHWASARDPIARLHRRVCDWLTEPDPTPQD